MGTSHYTLPEETKICYICGTEFGPNRWNHRASWDRRKVCSPNCARKAATQKRQTLINKVCPQCNTTFQPRIARNIYCSQRCYWISKVGRDRPPVRGSRATKVCLQCHHIFEDKSAVIKIRLFCSRECYRTWMRQNSPQGFLWPTNGSYRGASWHTITKEIKKRDNYTCQHCGKSGGWLEVHHKIPYHSFKCPVEANHHSNLTTLCRKCHFIVEYQIPP